MNNDTIANIISIFLMALVTIGGIYFIYNLDKNSCYEQAELYETKVIKYSWLKKYCFVDMNGKRVNLDKYRVVNE